MAISSVTLRGGRGVTGVETRPWGSEPRRGLLLAQECFAPKGRPKSRLRDCLADRPSLGDLSAGKRLLCAMLPAGGGLRCVRACGV